MFFYYNQKFLYFIRLYEVKCARMIPLHRLSVNTEQNTVLRKLSVCIKLQQKDKENE